jgi:hypothetical protein
MTRFDWAFLVGLLGGAGLIACGTPGAPLPPALELAKPVTDLRAIRKGDKVFLAWTVPARTTDHQAIRHPGQTRVCRSLKIEIGDCKTPVAEIAYQQFPVPHFDWKKGAPAPKIQASYTDTLSPELQTEDPTAEVTYAVSVLNDSGRGAGLSNLVQVPSAPSLSPPEHFGAEVRRDGVLLSWTCSSGMPMVNPQIGYRLRIYRRESAVPDSGLPESRLPHSPTRATTKVADANFMDCSQPQFLDQTFEWEKRYEYFAAVVTVVASPGKPEVEVEGDDALSGPVLAHDIFPPAVPTGLQAVFSGVGQSPFIDLVWSPDTEADLAGYNVFRREEGGQPAKLNPEPVKTPAYRDSSVQPGKRYFYAVSAIDERNNQSAPSEEASEQVP